MRSTRPAGSPSRPAIHRPGSATARWAATTTSSPTSPRAAPPGSPACGRGSAAEDVARDDDALDLRGALVDLQELGVAHELLDRVLLGVAVAAEDLDGVGRGVHGGVGAVGLGVARDDALDVAGVDGAGGLVAEQAGRLVRDRHLGEHELDRLVLRDRHAEGLALEGVVAALLEGTADEAGGAGGDPRPRAVEGLHRDLEAAVLGAEELALGDHDLLEQDVGGVRRP